MATKKKRKGCRNCKHGLIIRGSQVFPDVWCQLQNIDESHWDAVMPFGYCCDKHEWRNEEAGK
jgi:hypothetical protein